MNNLFFIKLKEELEKNNEVELITVVKGQYEGKEIVGKKLFKSNSEIFVDDESITDFWKYVLNNVNSKNTGITILEDGTEIFIESLVSKPNLVILGGGHVALPLYNVAKILNYKVTIVDEREEFANKDRFPRADNIICKNLDEAIEEVVFNSNTYVVIITRGHVEDQKCLELIMDKDFNYVGMMGSKKKIKAIFENLIKKGYDKKLLDEIHTPIGLDIGAETPSEIAISIMSEIIKSKNKENKVNFDETILKSIISNKNKNILVNIIEKTGSSPRGIGAKMLVNEESAAIGTVGGGKIENIIYNKAIELIKEEKSLVEAYDLGSSKNSNTNMICGGTVKVIYDFISV